MFVTGQHVYDPDSAYASWQYLIQCNLCQACEGLVDYCRQGMVFQWLTSGSPIVDEFISSFTVEDVE